MSKNWQICQKMMFQYCQYCKFVKDWKICEKIGKFINIGKFAKDWQMCQKLAFFDKFGKITENFVKKWQIWQNF